MVDWYINRLKNNSVFRINIYSDNIDVFWENLKKAFSTTALYPKISGLSFPKEDNNRGLFLDAVLSAIKEESRDIFVFLDDFHLLNDINAGRLLSFIAKHSPKQLHVIVAARNQVVSGNDILELGSRLYTLNQNDLSLNFTEISSYCLLCDIGVDDEITNELLKISEGWFSAIYLCLKYYLSYGVLPDKNTDIYTIMDETLLAPLDSMQQTIIVVMCLADEFTLPQAEYILKMEGIGSLLSGSAAGNTFIIISKDGTIFRFHNILKECAKKRFERLDENTKKYYIYRYGLWYETHGEYYKAIKMYHESESRESMLRVIGKDRAEQLSFFSMDTVVGYIAECSDEELAENPYAILVLMRRYFSWRMFAEMNRLHDLLIKTVSINKFISDEERSNILGECDLVMSFTVFNDINKMSEYHRSAHEKMTRSSQTIGKLGTWTFGSPSVLALFHRSIGGLDVELTVMHECMPYYYKLTYDHGMGAEYVMQAEAEYLRGDLTDAEISIEKSIRNANEKNQFFILACCQFLKLRISFFKESTIEKNWYEQFKERITQIGNPVLLTVLDTCAAYYYSLISQPEKIPDRFNDDNAASDILFPAKPIIELIRNRVLLTNGEYVKIIARYDTVMEISSVFSYELCKLYLNLQMASSYLAIGKTESGIQYLNAAIDIAAPDKFIIPFVEYYPYINEVLPKNIDDKVRPFVRLFTKGVTKKKNVVLYTAVFSELSEREKEIAALMGNGLRNKDIAENLCLTEGSVKQYINHIYSKLMLEGTATEKRRKLIEILNS